MTYRMALGATAFALMAALVPAAVGAQGIGDNAGVYRLTDIDSDPLPVVTDIDDEGRCREELSLATLTLRNNGTWALISRERRLCDGDFVEELEQDLEEGIFVLDGSMIMFLDEDGRAPDDQIIELDEDDAGIEDLEVGTVAPGALSVRLENGSVAVFRR